MSASTSSRRPIKGILKKSSTTSSVAGSAQQSGGPLQEVRRKKSQKWDESSILATYRSEYRDYDFMKMNEPSTPQFGLQDYGEGSPESETTALDNLVKRFAATYTSDSNYPVWEPELDGAHSSKMYLDRQEKRRQFEMKRKLHHSEGKNIKFARQLISRDLLRDFEDDKNEESCHVISHDKTQEEAEQGATSDLGLQAQTWCFHDDDDEDDM